MIQVGIPDGGLLPKDVASATMVTGCLAQSNIEDMCRGPLVLYSSLVTWDDLQDGRRARADVDTLLLSGRDRLAGPNALVRCCARAAYLSQAKNRAPVLVSLT